MDTVVQQKIAACGLLDLVFIRSVDDKEATAATSPRTQQLGNPALSCMATARRTVVIMIKAILKPARKRPTREATVSAGHTRDVHSGFGGTAGLRLRSSH